MEARAAAGPGQTPAVSGAGPASTATWRPTGPKTRPFRFGLSDDPGGDPELPRGTMVGAHYRILGALGEGGMGRVYEAEVVSPGAGPARVALKILRRERGQGDHLARFRQEARSASRVGHPAIVEVLDFAELPDGTVYLAMERLYGQSFEDWLEAPGRLVDGLRWLAEIARGLHAAHAVGIVHRDIKPANLFLHVDPEDPQARVHAKILDFGIAKVITGDATRIETQAGTLLGTPYYLAPERALGRSLDARADLYSLGVLLYEILTGLVPFEDESFMGILAQHIQAVPLDPRQAAPDRGLPPGICMLTMQLLAKEPQARPPDGTAVAAQIEALLHTEAAALAAVTTGPRQAAAVGDDTVMLQDIALRPTAAPDGGGPLAAATTRALGSGASGVRATGPADPLAQTLRADPGPGRGVADVSGVTRPASPGPGGSGGSMRALYESGPMGFAEPTAASSVEAVRPSVEPSDPPPRGSAWRVGVLAAVVLGAGATGWALTRDSAVVPEAEASAGGSAGAAVESAADGVSAESAEAAVGGAPVPGEAAAAGEAAAKGVPAEGEAAGGEAAGGEAAEGEAAEGEPAEGEAAAKGEPAEGSGGSDEATVTGSGIPTTGSGAKTSGKRNPRPRRPRSSGSAAPPPPDFKE